MYIGGVPHVGAVPSASAVPGSHSLRTCALWRPMCSEVKGHHRLATPLGEAVLLSKKGCSALRSSPQVSSNENKVRPVHGALWCMVHMDMWLRRI